MKHMVFTSMWLGSTAMPLALVDSVPLINRLLMPVSAQPGGGGFTLSR